MNISAIILTKNSASSLGRTLDSLSFLAEVVVYDTGSTDSTREIAAGYPNVKMVRGRLSGFGKTRNQAAGLAKNPWIFAIDSDEVVSSDLQEELTNLQLAPTHTYSVARRNWYNGKWIRCCGWHPDRKVRLYHKMYARFREELVHEALDCSNVQEQALREPLDHYPYEKTADFLQKMQLYGDLFAKQYQGSRRSSPLIATFHSCCTFLKSYFLQRGFLEGKEGWIIARYQANSAFYKYLKLWEANQKK